MKIFEQSNVESINIKGKLKADGKAKEYDLIVNAAGHGRKNTIGKQY